MSHESRFASVTDPTDLDKLRAAIAAAPEADRLVNLGLRTLVISDRATDEVPGAVAAELSRAGVALEKARVFIVVDSTRIERAGHDLKAQIANTLSETYTVTTIILGDNAHLQADDATLDEATEAIRGADCVVTIGGGTITDIGKVATGRNRDVPLIVVQTAASVDGFTDNVSVILRNGVKRTIDSRWPEVVLADTTTIAGAPLSMNTAGFGEVLSLYTAPADWELAHLFGFDDTFHLTPRDMLLEFAGNPAEWGAGLEHGDSAAVTQLTRVLAIRGIGTGVAGSTACLSGVEHLISHMLDMYSASHDLEIGLHGAQVGVGSVVAAAAWEYLLERLAADTGELTFPDDDALESQVSAAFSWCDPSGEKSAECWSDYRQKLVLWRSAQAKLSGSSDQWRAAIGSLSKSVPTPASLAESLVIAGAAVSPADLGDWLTDDVWRWAVSNCNFMRNRFTVVDLLFFFGWWTESDVTEVISRSHTATAAATAAAASAAGVRR